MAESSLTNPMTIAELKRALSTMSDDAWVCLPSGPVNKVTCESGANEPFVLLEYISDEPSEAQRAVAIAPVEGEYIAATDQHPMLIGMNAFCDENGESLLHGPDVLPAEPKMASVPDLPTGPLTPELLDECKCRCEEAGLVFVPPERTER